MAREHDLGNGIHMLDTEYISKHIASMYLIIEQDSVAIIETGTLNSIKLVESKLKDLGLSFDNVEYIIPTHVHLDHAAGAGGLMQVCKNAQLVVHPKGAPHLIDPSKLIASTVNVYGQKKFDQLYNKIIPVACERVIEAPDNFLLSLKERELLFIETRGHARHHFCIWDDISGLMFTGDTFGISYSEFDIGADIFIFPATTPTQFEPQEMIKSIDKILSFQPKRICLTHFGAIRPNDKITKQLKSAIEFMADTTVKYFNKPNASEKISQEILDYFLASLEQMGFKHNLDYAKKKLMIDVELNTQGLLVWQQRQAVG